MKILTVTPIQAELDCFVDACREAGYDAEEGSTGKLPLTRFPLLDVTVAPGGLGKVAFAVHTQHLVEQGQWALVICAGSAGALVDTVSPGDVVIGTETVEHDIRNGFGKPLVPRFPGAEFILRRSRDVLEAEDSFRIHYGPIASGDEDVVDGERRAAVHAKTGALAVAWEGAGGARASRFSGVPFIEIRGVTDRAGGAVASEFRLNLERAMRNVAHVVASLAL